MAIISIPSISNSFENANTVKESNAFRAVEQSISIPSTTSVSTPSMRAARRYDDKTAAPPNVWCMSKMFLNQHRQGRGQWQCCLHGMRYCHRRKHYRIVCTVWEGSRVLSNRWSICCCCGNQVFHHYQAWRYPQRIKEITINNGRKHVAQLAAKLRLGQHYVDGAHRLFLLAVQRNFVQGRRTSHVVAACLYIVCRTEKSPYLLIDFSDALQVNVYELGTCFLKFCRLLNLSIPLIEPTLYIHRFSSKLEFGGGEKTHQVAMTALRLVKRFKKDWIQTGRRPAGICATALFLASGMHGFRRTQKDIISVTRIGAQTLRLRLKEFSETPTALLTPEEFAQVDLPDECDPPSFTKNRLLEAQQRQKNA